MCSARKGLKRSRSQRSQNTTLESGVYDAPVIRRRARIETCRIVRMPEKVLHGYCAKPATQASVATRA